MALSEEAGRQPRLLAAPDKFRGTATAVEAAAAVAKGAARVGWACDQAPVADGGEGTLDALRAGGRLHPLVVRGPLGEPVNSHWCLRPDGTAVVEMALASGLELVGGAEANDPLRASTFGTGELIAAAIDSGASRVIVGVGGSATTDGGLGALTALNPNRRLRGAVELIVACDVHTTFVDAAEVFGPQKGATAAQVSLLRRRLVRLAEVYEQDFGVDVRGIAGSGAAGGLAGGLAAAGAQLVGGFDVVAEELQLAERMNDVELVVTGEGCLDAESFDGKAVGGVVSQAGEAGRPVLTVVGEVAPEGIPELPGHVTVVSLVDRFGSERATSDATGCIAEVVADYLGNLSR